MHHLKFYHKLIHFNLKLRTIKTKSVSSAGMSSEILTKLSVNKSHKFGALTEPEMMSL